MDFTSLYSHAGPSSTVTSPNDALLATATLTLLVLRDAESFQVLQSWRIPQGCTYSHLSFSQDSSYVAAACTNDKNPLVHLYSVTLGDKPAAVITPGSEGLQGIKWWDNNNFGKRWLACWARHNLRITVWDLETSRQYHVLSPKKGCEGGWAISPSEPDYVAVLERHAGKDHIGIYELEKMSLVRHFPLETVDAHNLSWSPCGKYLAVWESSLEYGLYIYSPTGRLIHQHVLDQKNGLLGLGIKRVIWHPSGRFLAVGGFDDKIRILADATGWRSVAEVDLPGGIFGNATTAGNLAGRRIHTFSEPAGSTADQQFPSGIAAFEERTHTSLSGALSYLTGTATSASRRGASHPRSRVSSNPSKDIGVDHLSFSPSGRFLVATSASPVSGKTILLLVRFLRSSPALPYTGIRPRLCTIIKLRSPTQRLAWRPPTTLDGKECLAIVTGQKSILIWNEEVPCEGHSSSEEDMDDAQQGSSKAPSPGLMEAIGIPSKNDFTALDVKWSASGSNMVLSGSSAFGLAWPLPVQGSDPATA